MHLVTKTLLASSMILLAAAPAFAQSNRRTVQQPQPAPTAVGVPATAPTVAGVPTVTQTTVSPIAPQKGPAMIKVKVPANAIVYIGDQKMNQAGIDRMFQSPALEPGKTYSYTLGVTYLNKDNQKMTASAEVLVQANQTSMIDFSPMTVDTPRGAPATAKTTSQQPTGQPSPTVQQTGVRTPAAAPARTPFNRRPTPPPQQQESLPQ